MSTGGRFFKTVLWGVILSASVTDASASLRRMEKAADEIAEAVLEAGLPKGASVAVLPFENPSREATELGRMLADAVSHRLVQSRRLTAIDRQYLSRMLGEIKLSMLGLTDQAAAMEVGRFSNASYLLVGSLEPYGKKRLIVQARLLDTEKAELAASARVSLKLDRDTRAVYERRAALDPMAGQGGPKDAGGAVLLEQTGKAGCLWVESRGEASMRDGRSAGRAAALSLARRSALAKVAGASEAGTVDFSEGAFRGRLEDVLRATRPGRVEEEKIVDEEFSHRKIRITLQSCLLAAREGADRDFRVELTLSQKRFVEGQEARAVLTPSRDAYLYLYSVDFDQNAIPVFPVPGAEGNKAEAGKPFAFPDKDQRDAGIRLVAELPKKADSSIEMFRAVAVRRDVGDLLAGAGTYPEMVRRLEKAGAAWAEDVRVFTIYKR